MKIMHLLFLSALISFVDVSAANSARTSAIIFFYHDTTVVPQGVDQGAIAQNYQDSNDDDDDDDDDAWNPDAQYDVNMYANQELLRTRMEPIIAGLKRFLELI